MKNVLRILLLIVLYCSSVYAKASTDSLLYIQFRDNFRLVENAQLSLASFYKTNTLNDENSKPIEQYRDFIPLGPIGTEENGVYWQAGIRLEIGGFDVLYYRLWHSSPKALYGPMSVDQLVAVYTRSGKLLDSRIILRLQDYYDGDIQGTSKPYNLNVKYIHILGSDFEKQLAFYRSYSISPHGKIEMSHTIAPVNVRSEIGKTRLWPKGRISQEALHEDRRSTAEIRMSASFAEYYMPIPDDLYSWEWYWGLRHSEANHTILLNKAFASRLGHEISARESYILTTIDKQGKVTDQRILGYNTPRELIQITSDRPDAITIDSYSLSFQDSYTLEDEARRSRSVYRVDAQGRISVENLFANQPIASRQVS